MRHPAGVRAGFGGAGGGAGFGGPGGRDMALSARVDYGHIGVSQDDYPPWAGTDEARGWTPISRREEAVVIVAP
jgi:hypothetical protein